MSAPSYIERIERRGKCSEGRVKTLPTKTYQVWAMESEDTAALDYRVYMHKIKMAYGREEVEWAWLLIVFL